MAYNQTYKNMYINKSLTSLCCIAPVLAFSVLLGGCNKLDTSKPNNDVSTSQPSNAVDTSKPNNNEVEAAIQDLYGSCPLWTVRNVQRIDGALASDQQSYAIASSFVLVLKDPAQLQQYVVQPGGRVLTSVEELAGFTNDPATSSDFKDCNLRAIGLMALNSPNHHITAAYQVQEADLFVQSERGWHLLYTNTTGINFSRETAEAQDIRDVEPIALTGGGAASSAAPSTTSTAKVVSSQSESMATPPIAPLARPANANEASQATSSGTGDSTAADESHQAELPADAPSPRFKDYAAEPLQGDVHPFVADSAFSRRYSQQLTSALQPYLDDVGKHGHLTDFRGVFAGHYVVATWDCGENCSTGGVIDLNTGHAIRFPFLVGRVIPVKSEYMGRPGVPPQDLDLEIRPNSYLLVVAGDIDEDKDTVRFYELTGQDFKLIQAKPWGHGE